MTALDWRGKRCGHNHPPETCPWPRCGYREALERIAVLIGLLRGVAIDEASAQAQDPRMPYLEVQVDRGDWALMKAELGRDCEAANGGVNT